MTKLFPNFRSASAKWWRLSESIWSLNVSTLTAPYSHQHSEYIICQVRTGCLGPDTAMRSVLLVLLVVVVVGTSAQSTSHLFIPANSSIGTIVKHFPSDLAGLTLLPSSGAGAFYLLNSGQLMLTDNLASKAGRKLLRYFVVLCSVADPVHFYPDPRIRFFKYGSGSGWPKKGRIRPDPDPTQICFRCLAK